MWGICTNPLRIAYSEVISDDFNTKKYHKGYARRWQELCGNSRLAGFIKEYRKILLPKEQPSPSKKTSANCTYCKQCGQEMEVIAGRKLKKFCSDKCRMGWWIANPNQLNRKATYNFTCACCGTDFTAYGNKGRKFCNHTCYIASRFGKSLAQ